VRLNRRSRSAGSPPSRAGAGASIVRRHASWPRSLTTASACECRRAGCIRAMTPCFRPTSHGGCSVPSQRPGALRHSTSCRRSGSKGISSSTTRRPFLTARRGSRRPGRGGGGTLRPPKSSDVRDDRPPRRYLLAAVLRLAHGPASPRSRFRCYLSRGIVRATRGQYCISPVCAETARASCPFSGACPGRALAVSRPGQGACPARLDARR
jgi:hypothetical protein